MVTPGAGRPPLATPLSLPPNSVKRWLLNDQQEFPVIQCSYGFLQKINSCPLSLLLAQSFSAVKASRSMTQHPWPWRGLSPEHTTRSVVKMTPLPLGHVANSTLSCHVIKKFFLSSFRVKYCIVTSNIIVVTKSENAKKMLSFLSTVQHMYCSQLTGLRGYFIFLKEHSGQKNFCSVFSQNILTDLGRHDRTC